MGRHKDFTLVNVAFWWVALPKEEELCPSYWHFRVPVRGRFSFPLRLEATGEAVPVTHVNNRSSQGNRSSVVKSLKHGTYLANPMPSIWQSHKWIVKEGGVNSSQVHFSRRTGCFSILNHFTHSKQGPDIFQCLMCPWRCILPFDWVVLRFFSHTLSYSKEWFQVSCKDACNIAATKNIVRR